MQLIHAILTSVFGLILLVIFIPKLLKELKSFPMTLEQAKPQPDSMWLVVVECRHNVIHVSIDGTGFYIPGQEPCWDLDHVAEWLYEIKP